MSHWFIWQLRVRHSYWFCCYEYLRHNFPAETQVYILQTRCILSSTFMFMDEKQINWCQELVTNRNILLGISLGYFGTTWHTLKTISTFSSMIWHNKAYSHLVIHCPTMHHDCCPPSTVSVHNVMQTCETKTKTRFHMFWLKKLMPSVLW